MREQREPWLKLPAKKPGKVEEPRLDQRFRTHVVTTGHAAPGAPQAAVRSVGPMPEPWEPEIGLLEPRTSAAPTAAAIERAAAAATLARPIVVRPEPPRPRPAVVAEPPRPSPQPDGARTAAAAPAIGLDDLPRVSSVDWLAKVGEAAKMVDVVVVFHTAAYLGTEMFEFAFRTVVNDVLPHLERPYTIYRFSLDDEPEFVPEMAISLGLPPDNPVTLAGFAWSGPGRRLFLLGDNALQSPAVFQRALRRSLAGERPTGSPARAEPVASDERPGRAMRSWSARAIAVLAWCLFGTAALGAAVVGLAPQWTSSLLYPTALPDKSVPVDNPPSSGGTQVGTIAPLATPDNDSTTAGSEQSSAKSAKPAKHVQRKHTSRLSLNPTYWGLPSLPTEGRNR
jgi:hypothetical protein